MEAHAFERVCETAFGASTSAEKPLRRTTCTAAMSVNHLLLGFILTILSFCLVSCGPGPARGDEFPGEYAYRSKYGQVECLAINQDGSFTHELYDTEDKFVKHGQPLFAHKGQITVKDGKRIAELLNISPLTERVTEKPGLKYYADLPWTPWFNYAPAFIFDDNSLYWLVKLSDREALRKVEFKYVW